MKKSLVFTYGLLIVLTITTALISNSISNSISFSAFAASLILGLSAVKFALVAFQFMELKKANPFWKFSLGFVLGLLVLVLVLVK